MSEDTARLSDAIVDAAIGWSVKLDHGHPTDAVRRAFDRWIGADPLHALAWRRVQSLRAPFAVVPAPLARATLDAADTQRAQGLARRRRALKLLSFGGFTAGTGWLAASHSPWQRLVADASTAVAEQKTWQLSDGTALVLNTDTAVSVDLAGDRRVVVLHRGEILVTTGHDPGAPARRPFWVHTPQGRLEALGTRFTVRLEDGRTRVSVQDGAVALHPARGGTPHVVRPGESRWLLADGSMDADLHGFQPDGFADGVIAGRDIRLGDLVDELARYRTGRIVCDARIRDLRLSGLFHVRDTDQALAFLAQTRPVRVRYLTRFWVDVLPAS